jgi:hypothetical protein
MYARVVTFTIRDGAWDEALEALAPLSEQIREFSGLRSWTNVGNRETGVGVAMAVFDSMESMNAVTDQVNEMLGGFASMFAGPPSIHVGEVLAHVDNS